MSACSPAPPAQGINDPFEEHNRNVHELNKSLDSAVVRPGAEGYGNAVPSPVRKGVSNFVGNLDMPRMVVNDLLQGRVEDAGANTFRFLINSTFGLGGLFDVAHDGGLDARPTDFGETLHVWGFREGRYLELPVIGPSTERDTAGKIVDLALNPLRYVVNEPQQTGLFALGLASRLGDRGEFSQTIDSVLYDSADSYAQARILYLQNRRFQLGGEGTLDYFDPYEDVYGTPADDPYYDPYEDPDAQ
jgi:phospholipid-binding lipoprotein MlaA